MRQGMVFVIGIPVRILAGKKDFVFFLMETKSPGGTENRNHAKLLPVFLRKPRPDNISEPSSVGSVPVIMLDTDYIMSSIGIFFADKLA